MARALYHSLIAISFVNTLINQPICSHKLHIARRFRTLVLKLKPPPTWVWGEC